jgi:archaeosine-15-forming tRNA-guanine transglycosylase
MVNEFPEIKETENVLTVDSLDELIKVGQALMKPVNHAVNNGVDIYWLTEGTTRYEYRVAG